ncbi:MAG: DUF2029 domain-containing protein, partial [Candidatus Omnitrophica bacterium]|nr:DUF2029 domain-containing protein [Candidatus Omnitrophota bacterium]
MRNKFFLGTSLLIIVLTFIVCWHYYHRIERFWGITQTDFNVYYFSGWYIIQKKSMYTFTNPEYLFKYAPIFGVAMIPLAGLPIQIALRWWYGLTCASFLGMFGLLKNLLKGNRSDLPPAADALLLIATLRPYISTLRLGQVDILLAFLLLA